MKNEVKKRKGKKHCGVLLTLLTCAQDSQELPETQYLFVPVGRRWDLGKFKNTSRII